MWHVPCNHWCRHKESKVVKSRIYVTFHLPSAVNWVNTPDTLARGNWKWGLWKLVFRKVVMPYNHCQSYCHYYVVESWLKWLWLMRIGSQCKLMVLLFLKVSKSCFITWILVAGLSNSSFRVQFDEAEDWKVVWNALILCRRKKNSSCSAWSKLTINNVKKRLKRIQKRKTTRS